MYYYDKKDFTEYPNGAKVYRTRAPFSSIAAVHNCPCEDGKRRVVLTTSEPDTFFSIPARVTVKRNRKTYTVSGFITFDSSTQDNGPCFVAVSYGKNGHLIKSNSPEER